LPGPRQINPDLLVGAVLGTLRPPQRGVNNVSTGDYDAAWCENPRPNYVHLAPDPRYGPLIGFAHEISLSELGLPIERHFAITLDCGRRKNHPGLGTEFDPEFYAYRLWRQCGDLLHDCFGNRPDGTDSLFERMGCLLGYAFTRYESISARCDLVYFNDNYTAVMLKLDLMLHHSSPTLSLLSEPS
jgi:hypothetical protein